MTGSLREIGNRVMMMVARGVLRAVKDDGGRQQLQVEFLKDELRDGVERMQNYGFTSHPLGGDVAAVFLGGNREKGIVLVVDDRRYRLSLKPGEVAINDDLGNKVELLRDMLKVTAVQHLEAIAPTMKIAADVSIVGKLTVTGDVATTGLLHNNGKLVGSTHVHAGVTKGLDNSGAPT
ncbi:phage baseplate assembly protein V [Pseudomonas sichuanensis]|uniref:phage baseplate assembly protein V n=1 Tax=Pseudomonas sichuanensis TaxID=2213015 RepID=UPI00215F3034|nr:phage baseplate assembly protein V [Pseudomonas sichuanensis]UVK81254.1 phage baseplate assembly protein V [Pseudomonas sichuanensis]